MTYNGKNLIWVSPVYFTIRNQLQEPVVLALAVDVKYTRDKIRAADWAGRKLPRKTEKVWKQAQP
jgi:hypothetical protein